jgi:Ca2+/Na+ antiporter
MVKGSQLFIPSDDLSFIPLVFLMVVYGVLLFRASKIISDGSEMLLAIYGPGIVGGLLIPILGAVPDGAIILFSGLGSGDVQAQLQVGVGTLAGSTIMLLTVPWALGAYLGRRDRDPETGDAAAAYRDENGKLVKLTKFSWSDNVVTTTKNVPRFSKIMMLTCLTYLIIQVPAFFYRSDDTDKETAHDEAPFALAGLIITVLALLGYSYFQLADAKYDKHIKDLQREAERSKWKSSLHRQFEKFDHTFETLFRRFDIDDSGYLDRQELTQALRELGLNADRSEVSQILKQMDMNSDGKVSEPEFTAVISEWLASHSRNSATGHSRSSSIAANMSSAAHNHSKARLHSNSDTLQVPIADEDLDADADGSQNDVKLSPIAHTSDAGSNREMSQPYADSLGAALLNESRNEGAGVDDEEEEEDEEEYHELTDAQLMTRAFALLIGGTVMITVFSDPMVEVITNVGDKLGIKPFYVSFVVTPLVSNASEVISALVFARKKTSKGISLTFASLYGAASMNNTFGLAIFMGLVYFRKLKWAFSAEVISIMFVTFAVGINGLRRTVNMKQAVLVALLFPFSIVLVAVLENVVGLD